MRRVRASPGQAAGPQSVRASADTTGHGPRDGSSLGKGELVHALARSRGAYSFTVGATYGWDVPKAEYIN